MELAKLRNDIDWISQSPVLMQTDGNPLFVTSPQPNATAFTPRPAFYTELATTLAAASHRLLGKYYECLCQHFLAHCSGVTFLENNRQLFVNKQTIGEIDQLYYCEPTRTYVHRELAVKFYLGLPDSDGSTALSHWIGPNTNDRFDRKLNRLLDHQCKMLDTEPGLALLQQLGIDPEKTCAEILLQGVLFYPFGQTCQSPPGCDAQHQRGLWLNESALMAWYEQLATDVVLKPLAKLEWLSAEYDHHPPQEWIDFNQLSELCDQRFRRWRKPFMVAVKTIATKQVRRMFIVPDSWIDEAQQAKNR